MALEGVQRFGLIMNHGSLWERYQPMRTRSCDESISMASRYFATVRRATGTPEVLSRSASLASDSGLRGFSLSIRRRIIDWMAMLEASPPPSVLTPEAKN